ncbi:MAG: hypothetical protein FWC71_06275 [Defluviitaleaceae bacterium]|nr:hypothetical protein [Defluviitaleaceae bacterium]
MAFPMVHLHVAYGVARALNLDDADTSAVLLGALAPDGVHYRPRFNNATQSGIGMAKKLSHLCPPGNEPWGRVTDNDGWVAEALRLHRSWQCYTDIDYMALGYVVHVLTDIYNNKTIWHDYRTAFPLEAVKGYGSAYYVELAALDIHLFHDAETETIMRLLPMAEARDFSGRVAAGEIEDVRAGLFSPVQNGNFTVYVGSTIPDVSAHTFVTLAQIKRFIADATDFIVEKIS